MRYAVLVVSPAVDDDGYHRLFGSWRDPHAAQGFADAINLKVDAAEKEQQGADGVRFHRALVLAIRPHRLRGPGGAYEWAVGE